MGDRTSHFDAQETCNAEQEAEQAGNQATPDEHKSIPLNITDLGEE